MAIRDDVELDELQLDERATNSLEAIAIASLEAPRVHQAKI